MAGTGLYWATAEDELRELAEALGIPVFLNGMGRGCLPADHELAFSPRPRRRPQGRRRGPRDRRAARLPARLRRRVRRGDQADLASTPSRTRLSATAPPTSTSSATSPRPCRDRARRPIGRGGIADRTARWVDGLRDDGGREARRRGGRARRRPRGPLHPMRVYAELAEVLDRERDRDRRRRRLRLLRRPRRSTPTSPAAGWTRAPSAASAPVPGRRSARSCARPGRQVCLLLGDGAFGFSGLEFDTMARHGLPGRRRDGEQRDLGAREAPDGVPLRLLDRRRAAARRPATTSSSRRSAATASSSATPDELRPALERAFASGKPALVNVLTDPEVVYPRRAVLA